MNIRRIIRKITRRTPNPRTLILPGAIVLLTIGLTFTIMTLLGTPRAPRLKSGTGESLYTAVNKTYSVGIGSKSGSPQISFSRGESGVQFVLAGSAKVKPVKSSGTSVTFPSVSSGVDLIYTTQADGLKEELILHQKPKNNTFLFDLTLSNATGKKLTNNLIGSTFYDKENQYLFHFEKPYAIDARGVRTDDVLLQIGEDKQLPGKYYLKLIVDEEWLASPTRAYPISVDPTIVHDTTAEFAAGTLNRVLDTGSGSDPRLETYYQPLIADEYTVGLWHMDEASGNLLDASGNGFTGLINGTTVSAGKMGNARTFNGTSDYVNVGNWTALPRSGDLTLESWFKTTDNGNTLIFLNHGDTSDWLYQMSKNTSNGVTCKLYQAASGAAYQEIVSTIAVNDGNWHHTACVVQGTSMKLYLDGRDIGTNTTVTGTRDTATAGNLSIGRFNWTTNYYFVGSLDDIRISNIARSSEEIKASASRRPYSVYTSEVLDLSGAGTFVTAWNDLTWTELGVTTSDGETLKDSTSLVAQWNFNETSGTVADNVAGSCGSSCDGTLTNFASTASQDQAAGTGWTTANKRWGAGALMFDGTNDRVCTDSTGDGSCEDVSLLDVDTGSFSVEAWVKTSSSQWQYIMTKGTGAADGTGVGYGVAIDSGKMYSFIHDGTRLVTTAAGSNIDNGMWHHLVWTFDRSSNVTYYLDGKSIYTESISARSGSLNNSQTTYVGYFSSGLRYFNGTIDSTRFYSRILTSSEILSNYQAAQIELQTRVGSDTSPDDGNWEAWNPVSGETLLEGFENNEEETRVYEMGFSAPGVNPTWAKKNNTAAANSDTTSTDGRLGLGTNGTGDDNQIYGISVIKDGSTYKMWYGGHDGTNLRTYYATSSDGLTWTKYNNAIPSNSDTSSTDGRIPLGTSGTADDFHAAYPTVIKDGSTYKMWYSGYDGTNFRILYATSSDGLTWTKYNNSIEAASNTTGTQGRIPLGTSGGDTTYTFSPAVIKDGSTYKMWYTATEATNFRIYYATSSDGLTWTKYDNSIPSASDNLSTNGRIPLGTTGLADDAYAYSPSVIKDGSIYKMWYNMHDGTNLQIGYATSLDGLTWSKYHNAIPATSNTTSTNGRIPRGTTGGDTTHSFIPTVIKDNGIYKAWYSGNDGTNWRIYHATMTPIPLAQSSESIIKQESSYSEKFVTAPQVDGSVVGLWHMDETGGTGAYIKDSSSNANHGTPTGTTSVTGVSGKGRLFNGSSDVITVPDHSSLDTGGTFTIEAWVYANNLSSRYNIYSTRIANPAGGWQLEVGTGNGGTGRVSITGLSTWIFDSINNVIFPEQWTHIAYVRTSNSDTGTLYINGQTVSATTTTAYTIINNNDVKLIGSTSFPGKLDEVRHSSVARSAEEIAESYRMGRDHYINKTIPSTDLSAETSIPFYVAADRPGTYLQSMIGESAYANYQPDSNTVALIHLDEKTGSGAYIKDSSTNANNGTPTGAAFVDGKIGKARYFDNSNDVIDLGSSPTFDFGNNGAFTQSGWIYPTTLADYDGFVSKVVAARNGTYSYMTVFMADGRLSAYTGSSWVNVCPAGSVRTGIWQHVAFSYNGTTLSGYVNGAFCGSVAFTYTDNTAHNVFIGSWYVTTQLYDFNGYIDEVTVSNNVRTATEIRQAYEVGLRTHPITIDFGANLDSGNLIADSNDLSFTVDATVYGLAAKGSMLFAGEKVIVKENYDGTEYFAQGTVTAVTSSTGAVTIAAWDSGSTFPSGGYTSGATVFKWQREYWNIDGEVLDASLDAITQLSLRLTDGAEGRSIYLDDLKSSSGYLTNPAGSTITSSTGNRYGQYRAILTSFDEAVSATISAVTVDYEINVVPNTPTLDSPTNAATGQIITPTLLTTATDTNSDYLRYKIELCTNVGMTTGCQTFDQTSTQTGWSGQNAQTSTAYTSGTQASYTIQSALNLTTTYYWRSYAIDPAGTNTWSSTQGTPFSFTTHSAPTSPTTPWAEGSVNPTAITDLTPEFSAIHADPDGDPAVFYEIEVNTNNTFSGTVMWDTGSTAMASLADGVRSSDVTYAGTIPSWGTTYYWRIRFTDDLSGVGAWSATQSFNMNSTPTTPTLSTPSNGATTVSLYPALQTVTTDSNSDYLRYKIELCTNVGMTTGCQTFDQTSSQTGWSGQNAQTSTAYTSGTQASYTVITLLAQNTTYYWRSYAIDPIGTDTWSSTQGSPYSFTTKTIPPEATECRINESNDKTSFLISWTDRSTVETGYEIQKSVNGGAWSVLATGLAVNTITYTDSPITAGSQYSYRIAPYITAVDSDTPWCTTSTLLPNTSTFKLN